MFVVFKNGGRQYHAVDGDIITIDKLKADPDTQIDITEDVILAQLDSGEVLVSNSVDYKAKLRVTMSVQSHDRNKKLIVFKKRRRHNSRRKNGHKQPVTVVKISVESL